MPQRTRGATELLSLLYSAIDTAAATARDARIKAKDDPIYVANCLEEIGTLLIEIRTLMEERLEKMLERQAPEYDRRLKELESRVDQLISGLAAK